MAITEVYYGDVGVFYDKWELRRIDESGCNQWAHIVGDNEVLFIRNGRVTSSTIEQLLLKPNLTIRRSNHRELCEPVAQYFKDHRFNTQLFRAGERALLCGNLDPFKRGKLFPDRPNYKTSREFDVAWKKLLRLAKPFDQIYSCDTDNNLSRFIAWSTGGPFSHVGLYEGKDIVAEFTTKGFRRGSFSSIYKRRTNWVAIYRFFDADKNGFSQQSVRLLSMSLEGNYPKGFNWKKASWYGLKSFFGYHNHALIPNSNIYMGNLKLIAQA